MFKKIITIVLPIIAVTAAIFVFGLKVYQDSFDKFQYDKFTFEKFTYQKLITFMLSKYLQNF